MSKMDKAIEAPSGKQNEPITPSVTPKSAELKAFTGYGSKGGGMGETGCGASLAKGKAEAVRSRTAERGPSKRNY